MRCEKVVTNAVESAPSANRSRSMLGARNAVRNASMFLLAPKSDAKTTSRSNPRMRLHKIAIPTTPVARVLTRLCSVTAIRPRNNSGLPSGESEICLVIVAPVVAVALLSPLYERRPFINFALLCASPCRSRESTTWPTFLRSTQIFLKDGRDQRFRIQQIASNAHDRAVWVCSKPRGVSKLAGSLPKFEALTRKLKPN
jgi:hypothetical protein